ncbi:MAG: phosphoglycerate mutase family protein [Flavobacterium sp.]
MKNYFAFLLLFLSISLFAQAEKSTRIYLVRHAEKITSNLTDNDPLLTDSGTKRATALFKKLKQKPLTSIYSTDYKRTKNTAMPTAEKRGKEIKLYNATDLNAAAATILKENNGKQVLVVGHSNTVLETIEALGGQRPIPSIEDQDYDYLFILTIATSGKTKVKVMHYGQPNSYKEGAQMMR